MTTPAGVTSMRLTVEPAGEGNEPAACPFAVMTMVTSFFSVNCAGHFSRCWLRSARFPAGAAVAWARSCSGANAKTNTASSSAPSTRSDESSAGVFIGKP
jgi:hypothetical protein